MTHTLEQGRTIGDVDGPLSFGRFGPIAAHESGLLAVVDEINCEVVIIDTEEWQLVRRVGRCGSGPSEFGNIRSLALTQDTLYVFDKAARAIIVLDIEGKEVRRVRPDLRIDGITYLGLLDDTTFVAALELRAARYTNGAEAEHQMIALLHSADGRELARFHRDDELSIRNRLPIARNIEACVSPHVPHQMATLSIWEFAGTFRELPGAALSAQFATRVGWATVQEPTPGGRFPSVFTNLECAKDYALFRYLGADGTPPRLVRGHLELRSYDGTLVYAKELTRADSALFGSGTGLSDRFFLATNSIFGWPQIFEFHIVPR